MNNQVKSIIRGLMLMQVIIGAPSHGAQVQEEAQLKADQEFLRTLAFGHVLPRALHIAAELKIADHVPLQGTVAISTLAEQIGAHSANLLTLVKVLAQENIFTVTAGREIGNSPRSLLLRSQQPGSMRAMVAKEFEPARWNALGQLDIAIVDNRNPFVAANGQEFYDYLDAHPVSLARFNLGMANYADREEYVIARTFDFSAYQTIVDIGGGMGGLVKRILKATPSIRQALNLDMPATAEALAADAEWQSLGARAQAVGGSFFAAETIPTTGDAYILKRVLHNWDDVSARRILGNLSQVIPAGSDLIVMEGLAGREGTFGELFTLALGNMKKRTQAEVAALCLEIGFELKRVVETDSLITIMVFSRVKHEL